MKTQIFTALAVSLALVACQSETVDTPPIATPPAIEESEPEPINIPLDAELPNSIYTEAGKEGFIGGLECMVLNDDDLVCAQVCVKNQKSDTIAGCLKAIEFMSLEGHERSILSD